MRKVRFTSGFAIMLVLMMLFLLFMLGVAFFFSAWTHAFMARNYLNMKRAFVVAEGGVHHAIGNIIGDFAWVAHAQNKPANFRWKYWGDVEPGTPEPNLVEITKTPVEHAEYPSYAMPKTIEVFGEKVGLSGVMDPGGGAYGINSDIFHLKVTECSAQLYVNEGLGHPYNTAVMRRILNNLGAQVDIYNLGGLIMDNRPSGGYKSKGELKAALDRIDRDIYPIVKDFLCVHTWSDSKVANPVPLSLASRYAQDAYHPELFDTRPINQDTKEPITRYGRDRKLMFYEGGPAIDENLVYGYDELNPCYIEITSRAPVNINTAPREILVALLMDIEGFFVMEQLRTAGLLIDIVFTGAYNFFYPPLDTEYHPGEVGVIFRTTPIDGELVAIIAEHIIKNRPFKTWRQFNRFIDGLVKSGDIAETQRTAGHFNFLSLAPGNNDEDNYKLQGWERYMYYASQAIADAIKANFNPNLHLNELNPNAVIWQFVDKTDLIKNSTEFCFLPTGYFEIESVGRILRAEWEDGRFHISPYRIIMKDSFTHDNQIMGQRRLKVEVKLWDLYRETTQRDFYQGDFSSNTAPYVTNGNWACETGPELQNGYGPYENGYEGYVMLSTIGGSMPLDKRRLKGKLYRTEREDWDQGTSTMHAHYDFDFRLHHDTATKIVPLATDHVDPGELISGPYTPAYAPDRYRVCRSYRYTPNIALPLNTPSDHRTDGFYGERFSLLQYYSGGGGNYPYHYSGARNFPAWQVIRRWKEYRFRGTYSYWLKPNFMPELSSYRRVFSSIGNARTSGEIFLLQHAYSWSHYPYLWMSTKTGSLTETSMSNFWPDGGVHVPYSMAAFFVGGTKYVPSHRIDISPTLNHIGHPVGWPGGCVFPPPPPEIPLQYSPFRSRHWIWVTLSWYVNLEVTWFFFWETVKGDVKIQLHINSRRLNGSQVFRDFEAWGKMWKKPIDKYPFFIGGDKYTNSTSNATFDEFKVWEQTLVPVFVTAPEVAPCGKDWTGTKLWSCPDYCVSKNRCRHVCECICQCGCEQEGCYVWYYGCPNGKYGSGSTCLYSGDAECGASAYARCGSSWPWCSQCWLRCDCPPRPPDHWEPTPDFLAEVNLSWRQGRYYRQNDAEFISGEINLARIVERETPDPNKMDDPYGNPRWKGNEGLSAQETTKWLQETLHHPRIKLLGVSWTGYTGDVIDYSQPDQPQLPVQLEVCVEASDSKGNWVQLVGPFLNLDSGWAPVMAKLSSGKIRYRVRFNTRCNPENAILLETPVLDDLTIYWATRPQFVSWQESY